MLHPIQKINPIVFDYHGIKIVKLWIVEVNWIRAVTSLFLSSIIISDLLERALGGIFHLENTAFLLRTMTSQRHETVKSTFFFLLERFFFEPIVRGSHVSPAGTGHSMVTKHWGQSTRQSRGQLCRKIHGAPPLGSLDFLHIFMRDFQIT